MDFFFSCYDTEIDSINFVLQIQAHLDLIHKNYQDSEKQRKDLITKKHVTGLRLERAEVLINALADEEVFLLTL